MRRRRQAPWALDLFAENNLMTKDLVLPLFITEDAELTVANMPGVQHYQISSAIAIAQSALQLGLKAIMLFPVVKACDKTAEAALAYAPNNLIARAIKAIKQTVPGIAIIADVALDPYTSHGHDGILNSDGEIDNDQTLSILAKQAVMLAQAGADVVAPSDMMDGRVGLIRQALDASGKINTLILSYAAKYNSKFYGPFRGAIGSSGNLGQKDKSSYQQDIRNSDEAMHEIALDIQEGADWIMIKPGMLFLDIISRASREFAMPIVAYQVSGEYSMLAAYANSQELDFLEIQQEALTALKRAGARQIVCYNALAIAEKIVKK